MPKRRIWIFNAASKLYSRDSRGAAAVEFAILLTLLVIPLLNAIDFGVYAYDRMETGHAAQSAAQAAWADCTINGNIPATAGINPCTLWTGGDENNVAHGTELGGGVTVSNAEDFYCLNGTTLVSAGGFPNNKPADCSGVVAKSTDVPGDYVVVTATFTFTPIFPAVSIVGAQVISETAWMRLN